MTLTKPSAAASLPAKIIRPLSRGALQRERLFQRLDAARVSDSRITWIVAPPGAGKTVLISSYIESRRIAPLWYQLDRGDADPPAFFHYLGLAADALHEAVDPAVATRGRLPPMMPEHLCDPETFTRRFFDQLATRLETPSLFVLDNYHELPEEAALHRLIRVAAERLPGSARIFVISRSDPPAAFARWLVYQQMERLTWDDLRMTLDETFALIHLRRPPDAVPASDEWVRQAHATTRGWAAGLTLLMRSVRSDGVLETLRAGAERQILFDYFSAEIFIHLPESRQRLLLTLSVLPRMTVKMAWDLSDDSDSEELLTTLRRNHFLIMTREDSDPIYEFHPLFAEFLHARVERAFTAGQLAALRVRAAGLLARQGEVEAAADLYITANDSAALADLLLREAPALLSQGRHRGLDVWISAVPDEHFASRPWLLYWQGMARLPSEPAAARVCFEQAYTLAEASVDASTLYTFCAAVTDSYHMEWNNFVPLTRWLGKFESLRERFPEYPSREVEMRSLSIIAPLTDHCPDHPWLPALVERGYALLRTPGDAIPRLVLGTYLLEHYVFTGQLHAGERVVLILEALLATPGAPVPVLLQARFWLALFHAARGELSVARELGEGGLTLAEESGVRLLDLLLRCGLTLIGVAAGDHRMARLQVELLSQVLPNGTQHMVGASYNHVAAMEALLNEDVPRALNHARDNVNDGAEAGFPFAEAVGHLLVATACHRSYFAYTGETQAEIDQARAIAHRMRSETLHYLSDLLEATVAFDTGNEPGGLANLRAALRRSRTAGDLVWPMWGPRHLAAQYTRALDAEIEVAHVQRMIRRLGLVPPDPDTAPANWPWPVRIYTLGRFEIHIDGQPVKFSGKVQRKPLELLKLLIALGSYAVPETRLSETLWPDADGDDAHRDFSTTLHRLRRLLVHDQVLLLEYGCLSVNRELVWLDMTAFAAHAQQLDAASDGFGNAAPTRAVALYCGEFLPEEEAPWAILPRERARVQFQRAVEHHGRTLEYLGLGAQALDWYHRALNVAPLTEAFHHRLMQCHAMLGQRQEAIEAFGHYTRLLASQGLPGPGTRIATLHEHLSTVPLQGRSPHQSDQKGEKSDLARTRSKSSDD